MRIALVLLALVLFGLIVLLSLYAAVGCYRHHRREAIVFFGVGALALGAMALVAI